MRSFFASCSVVLLVSMASCTGDSASVVPEGESPREPTPPAASDAEAPRPPPDPNAQGSGCKGDPDCTSKQICDQVLACEGGVCVEKVPPCPPAAPGACKEDVCIGGRCRALPLEPPGQPCDDGNACTLEDKCTDQGTCAGSPKTCLNNQTCNPSTGACGCFGARPVECSGTCYPQCCPGVPPLRPGSRMSCGAGCGEDECNSNGAFQCVPGDGSNCGGGRSCPACPPGQRSEGCGPDMANAKKCACGGCF